MTRRDDRIDFFRGFALLIIFVDHVPWTPLSLLGLRSFSFADAAELFFFFAGLVAAYAYLPLLQKGGFSYCAARVWKRAWVLYRTHMLLFVFVLAQVAAIVALTGQGKYFGLFRVERFFRETDGAILPSLLLGYQPAYLDILPVYILFFLALPFILLLAARSIWLALAPSLLLYLGVRHFGWTLWSFPAGTSWYFNPLAWQLIFVLGVAAGRLRPDFSIGWKRWVFVAAACFTLPVAVMQFSAALNSFMPWIPSLRFGNLPVAKADLEWLRIVSFLALAIFASRLLPPIGVLGRNAACATVIRCGRNSLPVFCLGVLLALIGHAFWHETNNTVWVQFVVSIVGVGILLGFARGLDWIAALPREAARDPDRLPGVMPAAGFARDAAE